MPIKPEIFKAYDVRGLAGSEMNADAARAVGRALAKYSAAERVLVARDMRLSSPELLAALKDGIVSSGADVVDIGLATNPLFYFAVSEEFKNGGRGAGANVTASHNPKEYNGVKLVRADGSPIGEGNGMEEIRDLALAGKFPPGLKRGKEKMAAPLASYIERIVSLVPKAEVGSPKVVFDAGNGMAGLTLPALIDAYRLESTNLFFALDGNFPNHVPNPVKEETLSELKKAVVRNGAALGAAFDGDADRVGFVDERGAYVRGDIMVAFFAKEMLRRSPGSWITTTVNASRVVGETVAAAGGKLEVERIGSPFIKNRLRALGGVFGGELSTHFMFREMNYLEAPELAVAIVLAAIRREKKPFSEIIRPLLKYSKSPEANFTVANQAAVLKVLEKKYNDGTVNKLDGLRVDFPSWWFSIRASNTEPIVRLNVEAETESEMKERLGEIEGLIKGV